MCSLNNLLSPPPPSLPLHTLRVDITVYPRSGAPVEMHIDVSTVFMLMFLPPTPLPSQFFLHTEIEINS